MRNSLPINIFFHVFLISLFVLSCGETPTGAIVDELNEGLDMEMVQIPGGTFQMGSTTGTLNEIPVHQVTMSAFQMGRYEITQAQYQAAMGSNPSFFTGDPQHPVESVNWDDAVRFCNRLSKIAGLDTCYNLTTRACDLTKKGFRLPTEAEWEYACRAGTTTEYHTGENESDLAVAGWYEVNSDTTTHAVGGMQPNAFGLYDMHGNVREWCNDRHAGYSGSTQTDPAGPSTGISRVRRGGAYPDPAFMCRVTYRDNGEPDDWQRSSIVGFRVVRR